MFLITALPLAIVGLSVELFFLLAMTEQISFGEI